MARLSREHRIQPIYFSFFWPAEKFLGLKKKEPNKYKNATLTVCEKTAEYMLPAQTFSPLSTKIQTLTKMKTDEN